MKKILSIVLCSAFAAPMLSEARTGSYVTAGLVYAKPKIEAAAEASTIQAGIVVQQSVSQQQNLKSAFFGNVRLGGGYQKDWSKFFGGIEGFVQLADPSRSGYFDIFDSFGPIEKFNLSVKRQFTFGAVLKTGKYLTDKTGLYLGAGPLYSRFKTTLQGFEDFGTGVTSRTTKGVWGATILGGLLHDLSESLFVKAEYSYEFYKKYSMYVLSSTLGVVLPNGNFSNVTTKARYHSFVLSLGYSI